MKHSILGAACASLLLAASGAAQASLIDRGGGLIYDTDLNITWLANANYAGTTMTWANAMTWAANLSYYDSVRNVTYDDWRLPTSDTCSGFNCTGSEMGHLFYSELGGVAGQSIVTTHDTDYNLFTNVQSFSYWSATEYALNTVNAWFFYTDYGFEDINDKSNSYYAWAVRPGDVAAAASTVPVPAAAWLFGSGLLGLVGLARRSR